MFEEGVNEAGHDQMRQATRADEKSDEPDGHGSFGPDILEEYVSTYRDHGRVHGICEEYRAAATIDVEHDRADKKASKRIKCPMLHLWAEGGPLDTFYAKDGGPLGIWRQWAPHAQGQAMKGGHFFPEENPEEPQSWSSSSSPHEPVITLPPPRPCSSLNFAHTSRSDY